MSSPLAEALLEDYKLKAGFFSDVINRMQTQFQVVLTLEAAVATALIVSNTGGLSRGAKSIALLEVFLSAAWLMVGRAGRSRAEVHRRDMEDAGHAWAMAAVLPSNYRPVGAGPPVTRIAVAGPVVALLGWAGLLVFLAIHR